MKKKDSGKFIILLWGAILIGWLLYILLMVQRR